MWFYLRDDGLQVRRFLAFPIGIFTRVGDLCVGEFVVVGFEEEPRFIDTPIARQNFWVS